MKRKILLFTNGLLFLSSIIKGQELQEITGKRIYEHHSPDLVFPPPEGYMKTGYDFVNHIYYSSFSVISGSAYSNGEWVNIDLVEHNGPVFGISGKFGFTSGISTIWDGDIKGNSTTLWMLAPIEFDYNTLNNVSQIAAAFNVANALYSIEEVENNRVYIGQIRNTDLYVAIRCYNLTNSTNIYEDQNVYFDFDYKYGTLVTTGFDNLIQPQQNCYPNPTSGELIIENINKEATSFELVDNIGKNLGTFELKNSINQIDIRGLKSGVYFLINIDKTSFIKIIKE